MNCRFCGKALTLEFLDLVNAPPSNSFLTGEALTEPELFYPLRLFVCNACFLVQIDEHKKSNDIFDSGYVYYSSFSRTWLEHAKEYVGNMIAKYTFDRNSRIIEIASNDGYLLQYFKERGIPAIGIEPAKGPAAQSVNKGIETIVAFFDRQLARNLATQNKKADLLIGNNVLAHVPDLNDFVAGLKIALKSTGIITMEFPHLMQLVDNCQFDTIYHEHFSYLSFTTVCAIFRNHGLDLFDVEEIPTHGGSLRIYAKHVEDTTKEISASIDTLLEKEKSKGLATMAYYQDFQQKVDKIKCGLLQFLLNQKQNGRKVAAYGAAAKGNTLLNYCGIKKDLVAFVADASPHKQGKYLPGSHIPVVSEEVLIKYKPDHILILPWNLKEEIMAQLDYIQAWNGAFVIPIPHIQLVS